eukprot:CAMPEP_0184871964 /NCGR_PEP_ID=MMETSP0580-20130426/41018_1 /TAXON_ID=1118495 /ORGANISM="Dactyliosolen fragilissimus" /LENGTH=304 /DNA_ID=CAMNT_0027374695 /DNA_START=584 /DNA_END=1498 /DNA_ORIENTATION=+
MKEKLDSELKIPIREDDNNIRNIPSNTLLITGNIKPELKLSYTDKFTSTSEDSVFDFDNTFTPLNPGLHRKLIIYGNTAKALEAMKEKLDNELNIPITEGDNNISNIPGDTLLITGNIEPELKLSYTDKFTSTSEDSVFDFDNTFTPRILLATASCIGASLDSDEVYGVIRIGFPESTLNFIQEMGRCGRNRDSNQDEPTDTFVLIISLNDYVYMIERIYDTKESDEKETKENLKVFHQIMTREKKQESQRNDLLGVLKLVVLYNDGKCIHNELKKAVSNPYESNTSSDIDDVCLHACSLCLKT